MLIAQITDTHFVSPGEEWLSTPATKVVQRLEKVVDYLNRLDEKPDVVLHTGDATDSGDPLAYAALRKVLDKLAYPLYIIPGNHDKRDALREAFSNHTYLPREGFLHYSIENYPVRLIGLDTLVPYSDGGELCLKRLDWFEKCLSNNDKPVLIFMHHPPVKIGVRIFDQINCAAPPRFEKLVESHPEIIGIVTGHYHHLCVSTFGGKTCFLAPSVAPTHYIAHSNDGEPSALELEEPCVTMHRIDEGKMVSRVVRLREKYERIAWSSIPH